MTTDGGTLILVGSLLDVTTVTGTGLANGLPATSNCTTRSDVAMPLPRIIALSESASVAGSRTLTSNDFGARPTAVALTVVAPFAMPVRSKVPVDAVCPTGTVTLAVATVAVPGSTLARLT